MIARLCFSSALLRATAACTALALGGCATSADKYSFVRYGQQTNDHGGYDADDSTALNDRLALNYAAAVASILRSKYQRSRVTREASATAQIVLAGLGGAGAAAFGYSTGTLAVLGLGSAGIPELQRIFGAKERAQTYQDAVRLIEEAQIEYLAYNQKPYEDKLTQNGVTLFQRVTASLHVIEKTLAGGLPSIEDMKKATERMTEAGATASEAGLPAFNLTFANGDPPMERSEVKRFVGRKHPGTSVTAPPKAPADPRLPFTSISGALLDRRNALGAAWDELTPTLMRDVLTKQQIAGAAALDDTLAERRLAELILGRLGVDPVAQVSPPLLLRRFRLNRSTEKQIAEMEKLYRELGIAIPQIVPFDLDKAVGEIKAGFEDLESDPAKLQPYLLKNGVDSAEALAGKILGEAGLALKTPKNATQSLRSYRVDASGDPFTAKLLLKGLKACYMPVQGNPQLH